MNGHGLRTVGGTCSILLGISYALIGFTYVFLPAGDRVVGVGDPSEYYPAFLQNPTPAILLYWLTGIGAVLGICAVQAISQMVRRAHEGWLEWTSYMALFGFAVKAMDSFRGLTLAPMRAEAWVAGDASTRAAIGATRLTWDYHGWFTFGGVGLWVLVVSLLMLRGGTASKPLCYWGIATALAYELAMAGLILSNVPLLSVGVGLGSIAGSVWYIWMGLALHQAKS